MSYPSEHHRHAKVRPPAVAGQFYPGDGVTLTRAVNAFLEDAEKIAPMPQPPFPKAVIVPHAGYVYSGCVAAAIYAPLKALKDTITRVVMIGPAHRVALYGLATSSADAFATPSGAVNVDRRGVEKALELPQVTINDEAHALEHSLEVQLPFLQEVLGDFSIVPILAGQTSMAEVGQVIEALWGGEETLILISSDLSHYHDYRKAREMDAAASRAIEALDGDDIDEEQACGRVAIGGLLAVAKHHGLRGKTIDLRNSGDTAGSKDQVVGYGAYVFS